jgi:tripartite-type tricarboxylate transporter receptor subunit TctC
LQNTNGAAIAPALYNSLPFDAVNDFAPVTQLVASNLIVVASPKSGIASMQQLIAEAKANRASSTTARAASATRCTSPWR